MATLKQAKSENEIRRMGVSDMRKAYQELAGFYEKILNHEILLCPNCGDWYKADTGFYQDKAYATGRYPICKQCLMSMVEQRKRPSDKPNETKESVQRVLRMMNRVYDDDFYEQCIAGALDKTKEKNRSSPFATYITAISSLPNWQGKTWDDSIFEDGGEIKEETKRKPRKEMRKIFGAGFSDEDYLFLQDQYDDWCARTQVDSKSQQTYIVRICCKLLEIWKAQRQGDDTSKMDESLNRLMEAAKLQPKQNVDNAATDSLTFGQLIEKWEQEKPIPEPTEEFKDADGIGKYIRVWFTGWLSKALGLKANVFTKEYDDEISKYTVKREERYEDGSAEIYDQLFGSEGGGDG